MKNIYTKKIIYAISLLLLALSIYACRKSQVSIKEPNRYINEDIKSYSDLFEVFWNTMDRSYNYFYEQKRKDGMDWGAIYKIYKPKFSAMKTLLREAKFSESEIIKDGDSARKYFTDIIDPIIDRHFVLGVALPITKQLLQIKPFYGNMKDTVLSKIKRIPFSFKLNYMKNLIPEDQALIKESSLIERILGTSTFNLITGPLKSNQDIYYLSFNNFGFVLSGYMVELKEKYMSPTPGKRFILTKEELENSIELKKIPDTAIRRKALEATLKLLDRYNKVFQSELVKKFNEYVNHFNQTEEISEDFANTARRLRNQINLLENPALIGNRALYPAEVEASAEARNFVLYFVNRLNDHKDLGYEADFAHKEMSKIIKASELYQKFLNPLHKGTIKKLVIDLRGNGGGVVLDGRFFVERFVTKEIDYLFQRTREGNTRFDYTPWVPVASKKHKFGIPHDIPIVILTDRGSASMSEFTTLMLKSQGPQVVSMGDYTSGATAGLGSRDSFNGGFSGTASAYLTFYIPLMATRDINGQVVEGVGIKPDYQIDPPTDIELTELRTSPNTFKDRALEQAIKVLNGM